MDMIERVARAICESEKMNPDDALGGWVHWKEAAEAAIEACHEPTVEMLEAGRGAFAETGDIGDVYVAMICTAFSREFAF